MGPDIPDDLLRQFSALVEETMGLDFAPARWPDLRRGLAGITVELGLPDLTACAQHLLSAPLSKLQISTLAKHLTVGETYFLREMRSFDALIQHVMPSVMQTAEAQCRPIRIWSAACCTGEEPYTLAILLLRNFPSLTPGHVSILATDINPAFLRRAQAGVFGSWSFRDAPSWLHEGYFTPTAEGLHAVSPQIRALVQFAEINLVHDEFPGAADDASGLDIIFCRNVLMYFSRRQAQKVIAKLGRAQVPSGWLIVGPSECQQAVFRPYRAISFPDAILYQKPDAIQVPAPQPLPACPDPEGASVKPSQIAAENPTFPPEMRTPQTSFSPSIIPDGDADPMAEPFPTAVPSLPSHPQQPAFPSLDVIEFRLASSRYAVPHAHVRAVCPLHDLTPLPCTPPFLRGIIHLRGQIVPVLDIAKFFGLPEVGITDLHSVLILHSQDAEIGILADAIIGVRAIPLDAMVPPTAPSTDPRMPFVIGITEGQLLILDVVRMLADPKLIVDEEVAA